MVQAVQQSAPQGAAVNIDILFTRPVVDPSHRSSILEIIMKKIIVLCGLVFIGMAGWRISEQLSADAIGMALGVLFGVLAGLPVALLVLASNRRRERDDEDPMPRGGRGRQQMLPPGYGYPIPAQQPPVIVLAGHPNAMSQQGNPYGYDQGYPQQRRLLPGPQDMHQEMPPERRFKVVGETEEWIEEWEGHDT